MGAVEGDDVFPRLVRHFTGETVVAEPPRRLVVLATGQFDAALSLGVVPAGAAVKKGTPGPVPVYLAERYPLHRAAFAEVVSVGGRAPVDLSAVAAARPDLIVGTSSGAHGRVATELAEIAPTVLTGGGGFGWKRDFLLLAEALGKRTAARQVLRRYDERVARLRPVLAGVGAVSFVRFGPKGLEQYGLRSFVGSIATDLGLSRPATQGFAATSQLVPLADTAAVDADLLCYAVFPDSVSQGLRAEYDEPWSRLAAVRAGRAVEVAPEPWFANAGPTAADVVLDDLEASLCTG